MGGNSETRAIRVVVVDDEPLFCEGVAGALHNDPGFQVVGSAHTVANARELISVCEPDVAIVDYRVAGEDGTRLCRVARAIHPDLRVLMLTRQRSDRVVNEVFEAGASGFLLKSTDEWQFRLATLTVAKAEVYIDPSVVERVVKNALRRQRARSPYNLTRQEMRCLALVEEELSNREIGERLGISVETVKTHLKHAIRKIGAEDRKSAARAVRADQPLVDLPIGAFA